MKNNMCNELADLREEVVDLKAIIINTMFDQIADALDKIYEVIDDDVTPDTLGTLLCDRTSSNADKLLTAIASSSSYLHRITSESVDTETLAIRLIVSAGSMVDAIQAIIGVNK